MARTILHVDMDAYFASIEQRDAPIYRKRPLLVCHSDDLSSYRGVVAAASYEAREFGVKAGMSVLEAKLKLPNAVYVAGNYERYLYNTRVLVEICNKYSDLMEVYSIDEAFLDLTATARFFGSAEKAAKRLQKEIKETLRLTCSVGVGPSKLVAKMASEFKKPAGLTVIKPEELPDILLPLSVDSIPGVGRRMKKHLDALGIRTIKHLVEAPEFLLEKKFGVAGKALVRAVLGAADTPVIPTERGVEVKSFGQSSSLGKGSSDTDLLCRVLLGLCEGATRRMRKAGYLGKTVAVHICLGRMFDLSRQGSLGGHADSPRRIYAAAKDLLLSLLDERALDIYPVVKVGVSVSGLVKRELGRQASVFDALDEREALLTSAVDVLKNKYGERAVTRCSLLGLHGKYHGIARAEIGIF
jgi:DNA polymerase-4